VRPIAFLSEVHFLTGSHCKLRLNTEGLVKTDACMLDPQNQYDLGCMGMALPAAFASKMDEFEQALADLAKVQDVVVTTATDPNIRRRSKLLRFGYNVLFFHFNSHKNSAYGGPVEYFGERGCKIEDTYLGYDFESDHEDMMEVFSCDFFVSACGCSIKPLLFIWGEFERAEDMMSWHFKTLYQTIASNRFTDASGSTIGLAAWTLGEAALMLGGQSIDTALQMYHDIFGKYSDVKPVAKELFKSMNIVGLDYDVCLFHADAMAVHVQAIWLLLAPIGSIDMNVAFDEFPADAAEYQRWNSIGPLAHSHSQICEWGLYGARFPTGIYTRGCHWIPRMFA
jgi:hypothetical protein